MTTETDKNNLEFETYRFKRNVSIGADNVPLSIFTSSEAFLSLASKFPEPQESLSNIHKYKAVITEKEGDPLLEYDNNKKTLFVEATPESIGQNLEYILYCLSEAQRNEEGRLTMSGAAVSDGNESVLILGNKGAGKTTLALDLCLTHKYKIYGNDVLVVGFDKENKLCVFHGDQRFKPRILTLKEFPYLFDYCAFDPQQGEYDAKSIIKADTLGVEIEDSPKPIKKIVQVFLNADSNAKLNLASPPKPSLRLNLFENTSRYIRATSTPIINSKGILIGSIPSFDNNELAKLRINIVEKMINEIGIETVSSGKIKDVSNYLK